jgi:hypothetical protein
MEVTGARGGRRQPWAVWTDAMAAVLIGATLLTAALLTVAHGGRGQAGGTGANGTRVQRALAFAGCVRSHGAPSYPGPNSSGVFIMTPQNATGFHNELSPAMRAQAYRANLPFARCVHRGRIGGPPSPGPPFTAAVMRAARWPG